MLFLPRFPLYWVHRTREEREAAYNSERYKKLAKDIVDIAYSRYKETEMVYTLLIIILILVLIGALPNWSHAQQWGWGPSGTVATILVVLVILWALGILR